jgi:hypothetical protein
MLQDDKRGEREGGELARATTLSPFSPFPSSCCLCASPLTISSVVGLCTE